MQACSLFSCRSFYVKDRISQSGFLNLYSLLVNKHFHQIRSVEMVKICPEFKSPHPVWPELKKQDKTWTYVKIPKQCGPQWTDSRPLCHSSGLEHTSSFSVITASMQKQKTLMQNWWSRGVILVTMMMTLPGGLTMMMMMTMMIQSWASETRVSDKAGQLLTGPQRPAAPKQRPFSGGVRRPLRSPGPEKQSSSAPRQNSYGSEPRLSSPRLSGYNQMPNLWLASCLLTATPASVCSSSAVKTGLGPSQGATTICKAGHHDLAKIDSDNVQSFSVVARID